MKIVCVPFLRRVGVPNGSIPIGIGSPQPPSGGGLPLAAGLAAAFARLRAATESCAARQQGGPQQSYSARFRMDRRRRGRRAAASPRFRPAARTSACASQAAFRKGLAGPCRRPGKRVASCNEVDRTSEPTRPFLARKLRMTVSERSFASDCFFLNKKGLQFLSFFIGARRECRSLKNEKMCYLCTLKRPLRPYIP